MAHPDRPVARSTYTVPEAARLLGISRTAAYEAAARGDLQTLRLGRRLLVLKQPLDATLRGREAS